MNLRWTNIVTWISTVAALCLAAAAWYQASSNSRQVEALQHQTMISHYAASTAMLGSDEIAVRIGAIQALEHLAQVQPELFHLRVMRLLCAFIRQPVPAKPKPRELRADVQAALDTVIYRSKEGRRIEDQYRRQYTDRRRGGLEPLAPLIIDLSGSDLQWAELYRAQLKDVILDRVNLSYASGNAAVFAGASFVAAIAHKATFIDANFDSAKMLGGDWSGSVMQNSSFIGTRMPNRLTEAHLEGDQPLASCLRASRPDWCKPREKRPVGSQVWNGDEKYDQFAFRCAFQHEAVSSSDAGIVRLCNCGPDEPATSARGHHRRNHWPTIGMENAGARKSVEGAPQDDGGN